MASIKSLLRSVEPGRVRLVRGVSEREVLRYLEYREDAWIEEGRVIACVWQKLPVVSAILDEVLDRLADAALAVWPDWYQQSADDEASRPEALPRVFPSARDPAREMLPQWYREAAVCCRLGRRPRLAAYPPALQAAQLSLAIEPRRLFLVLALADATAAVDRLHGFARAAEWLATTTTAPVLVLVPAELAAADALDCISFETVELTVAADSGTAPPEERQELWIWPLHGKPHPSSPGEQLLAERLQTVAELGGLFHFNEFVWTSQGHRYLVDLLWPEGKVVVEVDGYTWHSAPDAFRGDRQRDFELIVSGYLPLRLPHDEVLADVEQALNKIRTLVAFRRRHPPVSGGHPWTTCRPDCRPSSSGGSWPPAAESF